MYRVITTPTGAYILGPGGVEVVRREVMSDNPPPEALSVIQAHLEEIANRLREASGFRA